MMGRKRKSLVIRADASAFMGTGHLMRCLALGQAWKDQGGQVVFVTACESETLQQRLLDEGFQVVRLKQTYPDPSDWERTSQVLAEHPSAWVVVDGYHFDTNYQLRIKEAGHPLLVIDDMAHLNHYYADIVLNQNLHAKDLRYSCEPYTRLLLGTKYVLLRREFLKWRDWKREIPKVAKKVLVTLGGTDPDNVTLKVIQALQQVDLDNLEAVVIVGGANPHLKELRCAAQDSRIPVRLETNVANMPEWMAWADMAVSAGGSTCWELAFMGVPSLLLVLAENQYPIAEELDHARAAVNLGWYTDLSSAEIVQALTQLLLEEKQRAGMVERAQKLVDGNGVFNTLKELNNYRLSVGGSI